MGRHDQTSNRKPSSSSTSTIEAASQRGIFFAIDPRSGKQM